MQKSQLNSLMEDSNKRLKKYNSVISEAEKSFRKLNSENMQGTLIQIEDYLDSNHLYAFDNWIDGVIWDGPNVKRYWVQFTLKYPYNKMPNPRGALRLVNTGATVSYEQSKEFVSVKVQTPDDLDPATRKPREEEEDIWLVTICVPRRFIESAIDEYEELEPTDAEEEPTDEVPEEEAGEEHVEETPLGGEEELEL